MSRTSAPPSTCALTSRSIAEKSPARSCSWKMRRPVGLIRSPMREKRLVVADDDLLGGRAEDGVERARRSHQAGHLRALGLEQALGALDRLRGVGRVAVGADRVGVLLGDGGAAHHDDHVVAHAGLLERVHVGLEHRHRRGEERREADDVGLVLVDRRDELLRGHLHAEVDHLEAGALEHDVDEVLADVVDVALDRAHQELADGLHAGLGEQRPQPLHRAGHRATRDQHLGDEEVAALEPRPDLLERGDEGVEEQRLRLHVEGQALVGQLEHARGVADQRLVVEGLQDLLGGHATTSSVRVERWAGRGGAACEPRSRDDSAVDWSSRWRPSSSSRPSSRWVGPEIPRAATTSPWMPRTGTATPVSPISSSSRVSAQPRSRVRTPSRRRSARSVSVAGVGRSSVAGGSVERVPGEEDLAERGAVGRARRPRSSRGCRGGRSSRPARPARRGRRGRR